MSRTAQERGPEQQQSSESGQTHAGDDQQTRANGNFTTKGAIPPVESGGGVAKPTASDRAYGGAKGGGDNDLDLRELEDLDPKADAERRRDQRFDNDADLEAIAAGTKVIKNGDTGRAVTKLQVALLDLGYLKGKDVDGDFRDGTEAALKKFQTDATVGPSGQFDAATLDKLRTRFGTRKPYVALSGHNEKGVHQLHDYEKAEALEALVPQKPGEKFTEEVAGEKYGAKVLTRLTEKIAKFHAQFVDHSAKRDKPAENFQSWGNLEGACVAGKHATDKVYGSYKQMPAFSHKKGTLKDYFEVQKTANKGLKPDEKKTKADGLVRYMINSQCADINKTHQANVDGTEEAAILDPIVASFVDTEDKVQIILDLLMDWPGAARGGTMFLQRYKADTDDKNREEMWTLFHTAIHEYIHTLKHDKYYEWANNLGGAKYHTLIEGFCDYFTLNVRSQLAIDEKLQKEVEGSYFDKSKAPPSNADGSTGIGVYRSHAQAEQVVSIVGIRNAQEAYFCGDISKMGAS